MATNTARKVRIRTRKTSVNFGCVGERLRGGAMSAPDPIADLMESTMDDHGLTCVSLSRYPDQEWSAGVHWAGPDFHRAALGYGAEPAAAIADALVRMAKERRP